MIDLGMIEDLEKKNRKLQEDFNFIKRESMFIQKSKLILRKRLENIELCYYEIGKLLSVSDCPYNKIKESIIKKINYIEQLDIKNSKERHKLCFNIISEDQL